MDSRVISATTAPSPPWPSPSSMQASTVFVAGFRIDHAIGWQTFLSERRRKQVRTRDAPKHLILGPRPRSNAGREQSAA